MEVVEAVRRRISVRAFKPDPVPGSIIREILDEAKRAPSGGNLQPWRVYALTGAPLDAFKALVATRMPGREPPEYAVYPADLWDPFRTRRFQCGEDLYASIGIERANKPGRLAQLAKNATFFGAPVGLFFCIDRNLGPPQWADLGMYMQTVMLLAVERGLDTCPQEFWSGFPRAIAEFLKLPDDLMVFSGMAMGYRDDTHPINNWRTRRDPFEAFAELHGFE